MSFVSAGLRKTAAEEKQQEKGEEGSDDSDDDAPAVPPPPHGTAPKRLQMVDPAVCAFLAIVECSLTGIVKQQWCVFLSG